jgi:tetratricopeptide (TPR) repeat protein
MWNEAWIKEVNVYLGRVAGVFAEVRTATGMVKYDQRFVVFKEGLWFNLGQDGLVDSLDEARANFEKKKDRLHPSWEGVTGEEVLEYAMEHPAEIRGAANQLFEAIQTADYASGRIDLAESNVGYEVLKRRDAWAAWVCKTFMGNPIVSVTLGEVTESKVRSGQGKATLPAVPYKLTLKKGETLEGDLPFGYNQKSKRWYGKHGLDWHLKFARGLDAAPVSVLLEQGIYTEETVGDLDRAIEIYSEIVADDQANRKYVAEALFRMGRCHETSGQKAEALEDLQKLVKQFPDQKKLVKRAKGMIARLQPKPLFPELEGCRLRYHVALNLSETKRPVNVGDFSFYQTDQIEYSSNVDPALDGKIDRFKVSLFAIDAAGKKTKVEEEYFSGSVRSSPPDSPDNMAPGKYSCRLIGYHESNVVTQVEGLVEIKPAMNSQIGVNEIQSSGDIKFVSVQQSPNHWGEQKSRSFINSDFVHIESMFDGDGKDVKFTEKHEGNHFRYHATLNKPVTQSEILFLGSRGWEESLVQKVTGSNDEYRYRMNHTPGGNAPMRRVEVFRLPQGAELLETTPADLPHRIREDGRVEILVDTIIPTGGSLLTEFRYRLMDKRAKIIVEDTALRLLVAIRDKEDDVLRELSADRIEGWRDALPIFAIEAREQFRRMTGEHFDMREEECLIQGDLAVVKCVGPEVLKGIYLVLFFERTESGWKNITMKNSPPSKSLQDHLSEMADTVREKEWDIQLSSVPVVPALKLQPAPWEDGEVLRYRLVTKTGAEMGRLIWAVNGVEHEGKAYWKVEQRLVVPSSGTIMASHVVAEKESFIPISGRTTHQLGTVDATYLPGKVLLQHEGAATPREVEVPTLIYDNEQVIFLMRRLPLAERYNASFPIMSVLSGTSGLECRIRVMARENIEVASESYDCWKVRIQVYMGGMKVVEQTAWFAVDGHVPVKFVTDQMDMELAEQTVAGQGGMELGEYGASLQLPNGWFGYELPTVGKGSEIVRLLPPEMKLEAMLCKTMRDSGSTSPRGAASRDIEMLKGYFKNYSVREDSRRTIYADGLKAAYVYAADYEDQGKEKVEYRAYYVADSRVFWFVFRMDRDQFNSVREELDAVMDGLLIVSDPEEELKACVRQFFQSNWRDLKAREGMEWGRVQPQENGSRSIRYKYKAQIWDGEMQVFEDTFTFDENGNYVGVERTEGYPQPLDEGKEGK